ncbi:MAG TPA: hypothetical protein PLC89_13785 [Haliscomenobacter sp.]|uniref:hypothetical protein n=1 Tax=Haliscomenobacter sp. TaxID=2717303 RepID=UPI002B921E5B|nr:hypothetical protein [Haliscomenobacter sp.]HOY18371.1 hypothetical protein [Haliscomenobacter sp.]HPH18655.1 hypothetical protein [Haliscomenobacter sp.]
MKLLNFLSGLFFVCCAFPLAAQSPGFNYQAVLRSANLTPISSQNGTATLAILNPVGIELYRETHNITTDQLGLFNLVIGKGNNPSSNFAAIDWSNGGRFVKISVAANGSTFDFFPTELQAVPYAKVAEKTLQGDADADPNNEIQTLAVLGNQLSLSKGGGNVTLPASADAQTLSVSGNQLSISNGNSVALPNTGWTDGAALVTTGNGKKIGIGTAAPQQKVHIHDQDQSFAWLQITNGGNGATGGDGAFLGLINKDLKIENCEIGKITLGTCAQPDQIVINNDGNVEIAGQLKIAGGSPGAGKVLTSDASGNATWSAAPSGGWTDGASLVTSNNFKNVGIGTARPQRKLHINDEENGDVWIQMTNDNTGTALTDGGLIGETGIDLKIMNQEPGNITLGNSGKDQVVVKNNGNVEIAGQLKIAGGAPGAGKILTSDANGLASWQNPVTAPTTGTIASMGVIASAIEAAIPPTANAWYMIGPTHTIAVNGNQRVVFVVTMGLGRKGEGISRASLGIAYRLSSSGSSLQIGGLPIEYYPTFPYANSRASYTISDSVKPPAGTYIFGAAITSDAQRLFDNNGAISGYYMVINE